MSIELNPHLTCELKRGSPKVNVGRVNARQVDRIVFLSEKTDRTFILGRAVAMATVTKRASSNVERGQISGYLSCHQGSLH
jgi:hypothetical protein